MIYGFGQAVDDLNFIAGEIQSKNQNKQSVKEKKRIKAIATKLKTEDFDQECYVDFACPLCGEAISYTKEQIKSNKVLSCPECCEEFYVKDVFSV